MKVDVIVISILQMRLQKAKQLPKSHSPQEASQKFQSTFSWAQSLCSHHFFDEGSSISAYLPLIFSHLLTFIVCLKDEVEIK